MSSKKKALYDKMKEAANDTSFMKDLHDSMSAFSISDAESAKEEKWQMPLTRG